MSRTLGPYEIRSKLGRGVASVFWRAYDPALEREVALCEPVLPHDLDPTAKAAFVAGFLQQGETAARLSHPGLVRVYAAQLYDDRPVLATEMVEGENLAQVLARGPLGSSSALYVLDQLLDAAAYAHAEGVVHEAITTENVLVTRDGRVKISGFGTARSCGLVTAERKPPASAPGYAAPEQIAGGAVDRRADLFAIGVLGYEMLSGANPFGASEGVSAAAISYRVTHEPPAPLPAEALEGGTGRADLPAVLGAALAKEPAQRFQSAEEFRAALHGGAVPTGTTSLAVAEPKVVVVEAAPVAVSAPAAAAARSARGRAAPFRRRKLGLGFAAAALVLACAIGVGLFFGLGGPSSGETTTTAAGLTAAPSSTTTESTASIFPSSTTVTLVPGTTTTSTTSTSTTTTSTTTTTLAPTTTEAPTTTVKPTTTTRRPTPTTRRPTTTTQRPTTTTQRPTTTTEFVTPTTLGPG